MALIMNIQHDVKTVLISKDGKPQPPKLYKVLLLNDDFTPMDFVVGILEEVFYLSSQKAEAIMLMVHYQGRAVCGIYAKDVAQMKVDKVINLARANEYPLQCIMEEE